LQVTRTFGSRLYAAMAQVGTGRKKQTIVGQGKENQARQEPAIVQDTKSESQPGQKMVWGKQVSSASQRPTPAQAPVQQMQRLSIAAVGRNPFQEYLIVLLTTVIILFFF
jgi:hypothetical protein